MYILQCQEYKSSLRNTFELKTFTSLFFLLYFVRSSHFSVFIYFIIFHLIYIYLLNPLRFQGQMLLYFPFTSAFYVRLFSPHWHLCCTFTFLCLPILPWGLSWKRDSFFISENLLGLSSLEKQGLVDTSLLVGAQFVSIIKSLQTSASSWYEISKCGKHTSSFTSGALEGWQGETGHIQIWTGFISLLGCTRSVAKKE